jgi:hypothetical protein
MKLTSFLKELITEESRFQNLYNKLVKTPIKKKEDERGNRLTPNKERGIMNLDTLKKIIAVDPFTRIPENFDLEKATDAEMEKVKIGKYTNWLLKQYLKKPEDDDRTMGEYQERFFEDALRYQEALRKFDRYQSRLPIEERNIDNYTLDTLDRAVDQFVIVNKNSKNAAAPVAPDKFKHPGAERVFTTPKWTVMQINNTPEGQKAAEYLGGYYKYDQGESHWCTSIENGNHYKGYIKDGPLYVILPNDDNGQIGQVTGLPLERYQFHFPSNQFMDRSDRQIDLLEYFNGKFNDLKEFFRAEFVKGYIKPKTTQFNLSYNGRTNDSVSRYLSIYGFETLFEDLPNDLTVFTFKNESTTPITLQLPNDLKKFTQLKRLSLQNCVSNIPDVITQLKNLEIISLVNNSELTSLPPIETLPKLMFVNLSGSNNVKFTESFLNAFDRDNDSDNVFTSKDMFS